MLARAVDTVTPERAGRDRRSRRGERRRDAVLAAAAGPLALRARRRGRPGNAGTLLRSAEAAGAAAVVFCGTLGRPEQPQVRAGLGRRAVPRARGERGRRGRRARRPAGAAACAAWPPWSRGGTPYDEVDLDRAGGRGARQRGPRAAAGGAAARRPAGHHPDGRPGRVAQRRHGGHGAVLRGPPPAALGRWRTAEPIGERRPPERGASPSPCARRDRRHRGRRPAPHRRAPRPSTSCVRSTRSCWASGRRSSPFKSQARRPRPRRPPRGRRRVNRVRDALEAALGGRARRARAGRARRAQLAGRAARPHRGPARRAAPGTSTSSPRPWRRSRTCSSAWASPSPRAPRSRPTGTTSGPSTSRRTTRPATCTTRSTSRWASRARRCCAPTPRRCRCG